MDRPLHQVPVVDDGTLLGPRRPEAREGDWTPDLHGRSPVPAYTVFHFARSQLWPEYEDYRRAAVDNFRVIAARRGYRGRLQWAWGMSIHGRDKTLVELRVYA